MTETAKPMPLAGMRILDLSTVLAAPFACTLLADFGAEVVKVELPDGKGDALRALPPYKYDVPLWWKVTNRNKRGITLDIRKEEGKELFRQMVGKFDVLVENFRPGTLDKYGFTLEALKELNPNLIILRVSGYGQTGPLAKRPGFARVAEAYAGFTALCGDPDRPPLHIGYPVADTVTGLFGAVGLLVAWCRQKTDPEAKGEEIDVSLVESMVRLLEFSIIEYDQLGTARKRSGSRSQYASPSNVYRTSDEKWFTVSVASQSVFVRFANAIGHPELLDEPAFATNLDRVRNTEALDEVIKAWFAGHTLDEVQALFEEQGVSGGPVNDSRDVFESEHLRERGTIIEVPDDELGKVTMQGVVPQLKEAPGAVQWAGPETGEHTDEVYSELLGLGEEELDALRKKQVI